MQQHASKAVDLCAAAGTSDEQIRCVLDADSVAALSECGLAGPGLPPPVTPPTAD
jgi:hypothetical protein